MKKLDQGPIGLRSWMHAIVTAAIIFIVSHLVSVGNFGFCESTKAFAQETQIADGTDAEEVYLAPLKPGDSLPGLRLFARSNFDSGNVTWVMMGAAALLLMVTPGLVLFNCGIQGMPNVSKIMNHYLILVALMSLMWVLWVYSLAFARNVGSSDISQREILAPDLERHDGNPFIGGMSHLVLQGLESQLGNEAPQYPVRQPSDGIPHLLHMVFHLMFFISVPAPLIVCLSERLRFPGMSLFIILWGTIVYAPITYWIWGGGWLSAALDSSGGIPAHVSVGCSALGAAFILGRRQNDEKETPYSQKSIHLGLGTIFFWGGMLLYNASRTFDAGGNSVNAFVTTHLAGCTGLVAWGGMEWLRQGKASLEGVCAGAIAGLITISSGNSFVAPQSAMVMGAVGGVSSYGIFTYLNRRFFNNDFLKIFALYAIPGATGVFLTGIFATTSVGGFDSKGNEITGLLGGNANLLTWQTWAICSATVLSLTGTTIILFAVRIGTKFFGRNDESR